jgi:hypothetical protein
MNKFLLDSVLTYRNIELKLWQLISKITHFFHKLTFARVSAHKIVHISLQSSINERNTKFVIEMPSLEIVVADADIH